MKRLQRVAHIVITALSGLVAFVEPIAAAVPGGTRTAYALALVANLRAFLPAKKEP